jgi:hypothetical protein
MPSHHVSGRMVVIAFRWKKPPIQLQEEQAIAAALGTVGEIISEWVGGIIPE